MISISQKEFDRYRDHLNPVMWLWIPILFTLIQILVETTAPESVARGYHNENGVMETLQTIIIFSAFIFGVLTIRSAWLIKDGFIKFWLSIAILGSLYIAGEEVSWGQHIFGWQSNEFWQTVNDQQETNFHNTSSWLDQKPRILIEIGIVIGGLIIPALMKWAPDKLPKNFRLVYPTSSLVITAALFLIIKLIDRVPSIFSESPFVRGSEVLELFMFYFILLYMIDFRRRIELQAQKARIESRL